MNTEDIEQMLADCEARESKLTQWEIDFIQSLSDQFSERALSDRQINKLEAIWERVTA
jgi:hypothetical protein